MGTTMEKKILAIDLGTQSVRAALVTPEGKIEAVTQVSHDVVSPYNNWAEQSAAEWWKEVQQVVKELLYQPNINTEHIAAVACCGQMHGPTGVDVNGEITTQMTQLWCDKRNQEIVERLRNSHNIAKLAEKTANPPTTGFGAFKVKWEKENHPEAYERTKWFLVPKDYVNFKLTNVATTDPSEASGTYLWDWKKEHYSKEIAELLGIDIKKFPPVHKSYEIIGKVTKEAYEKTGIPKDTPVVAGGGDFIVSLLGLGLVESGIAIDMTGTSTLFVFQKKEPIIHPSVQNLHHVLDGWIPFIMLDSGGLSIKFMKDVLDSATMEEISFEKLVTLAESIPPGSDGLIFYPYLLGERNPDNPNAKGIFMNLGVNHNAGHMARAVIEGVVLALAREIQNFRDLGIPFNKVILTGGATRNHLLSNLKANIWNVIVVVTDEPESSLQGGGLLGAFGVGLIDSITDVPISKKAEIINPDPELVELYKPIIQKFNRFYDHMSGYWSK
jgi:xylulokinase